MLVFTATMIIALNILRFFIVDALMAACPPGWLSWQDSCYILLPDKVNWIEASKVCNRSGISLIIPNSQQEHDFIWREMKKRMKEFGAVTDSDMEVWIGCYLINVYHEDQVVCVGDGSAPVYNKWGIGQPNNQDQCIRMTEYFGGKWGDIDCGKSNFVACEMEAFLANECRRSATRFTHVPQQCLFNHEIKSHTVKESIDCGLACWAEPLCRSFNLWQQADKNKICQLNHASRFEADVTDIKYNENCFFYEV